MYSVYIPKDMHLQGITSMYAVNATIKILPILTKVVVPLAFSEILPEASTEMARPVALLAPVVPKISKFHHFYPLIM